MKDLRVAIIHYRLTTMRGGEKVLESICNIFPNAVIYTHVYDNQKCSQTINKHEVKQTFIAKLPFAKKYCQSYLPLMPLALEQLDLTGYDLIISTESGPTKGVIAEPEALHINYCHSPMRYVWDMYFEYRKNTSFFKKLAMFPIMHYLKLWDFCSAGRVDLFIANSNYIKKRIEKCYRRNAHVIFPPVSFDDFYISEEKQDFYLMVGEVTAYKKQHLAVEAFKKSGKKLSIIGEGDMLTKLKNDTKKYPNIEFLGRTEFSTLLHYYSSCKALIFPGVEDFGIVPLEALASGTPVIGYNKGGIRDTIINKVNGILFDEQTEEALISAIDEFETMQHLFHSESLRQSAEAFSQENFENKLKAFIDEQVFQHFYK